MYKNFTYQKPKNFFHTFEADTSVSGLSFADEKDASVFYDKVMECNDTPATRERRSPSQSTGPPLPQRPSARQLPTSTSTPTLRNDSVGQISTGGTLRKAISASEVSPEVPLPPPQTSPTSPPRPQPPPPPPARPALPAKPAESPKLSVSETVLKESTPPPEPETPRQKEKEKKKEKERKKEKKEKKGFFSRSSDSDILPISEPTNFRHVSSIGWNPAQASFGIVQFFQIVSIQKFEIFLQNGENYSTLLELRKVT